MSSAVVAATPWVTKSRTASSAPYTTRIVVNRPADPARFNGTVVVTTSWTPRSSR
ncbi:alpha/beta hydrolase domain-containing protein [Streptomyces sp. NBC_00878]|uniref:alpha/beta hydrolase domain-containing protein n=1 Tax=Streptomyces sp. NBC_00878 TaxID=2975854 RepID=UPI00339012AF